MMNKMVLMSVLVLAGLAAVAAGAESQGCGMPNMSCGSGANAPASKTTAADTPADNLLHVTGTVVTVAKNGCATVDLGACRVLVAQPVATEENPTPPAFKLGDRVQITAMLQAVDVSPAAGPTAGDVATATFKVDNILCGMCSNAVQQALRKTPGVKQATVSTDGTAVVEYDAAVTNPDTLVKAMAGAKHPHNLKFTATLQ